MPAILSFTLPSNVGCASLSCGVDNHVMIQVKAAALGKVADASGYVQGVITETNKLTATSWTYIVSVSDDQIITGQNLLAEDVFGTLSCVTGSDKAILAKSLSLQVFPLKGQAVELTTGNLWLYRRHRAHEILAMEIALAAVTGTPEVTFQLQKSGANDTTFVNVGAPLVHTITSPVKLTNRFTYGARLSIGASEALRVAVTVTGSGATATGLDLTLITSELP